VYSHVPRVNRVDIPETGSIHLKVGIKCVLFLAGLAGIFVAFRQSEVKDSVEVPVFTPQPSESQPDAMTTRPQRPMFIRSEIS